MYAQFTQWVREGVPLLFYTDFLGERLHAYPLQSLASEDIQWCFGCLAPRQNHPHQPLYSATSPQSYHEKFQIIQEEIRAGNTYLLNLTQPTPIHTPHTLREIYAMAYAPYKLRVKDHFVCFSPEPFITIVDDTIHTYPMKGTIDASIPDAMMRILNDPKESAEHTMIVDLLRNDLGIIGSQVRVESFRDITTINTGTKQLYQVSSHIRAQLPSTWREECGTILKALLPAGSISGTPKHSTVEIIQKVEGYDRGYFTGVFGVFDGKNLHSAVSIRFIENINQQLIYKSGGGITILSDFSQEYQEMLDKIYIP